jgi:hypothetical protein
MKKQVLSFLTVSVLAFGSTALVTAQSSTGQTNQESQPVSSVTRDMLVSVIDGIEVPFEVVEYAQVEYQGHAIIKAEKTRRGGQEVYQLTVSRDTAVNPGDIYLIYDMNWELIDDAKVPEPPKPEPKPEPEPEENDEDEERERREREREQRQQEREREREQRPTGGRGGGEAGDSGSEEESEDDDEATDSSGSTGGSSG